MTVVIFLLGALNSTSAQAQTSPLHPTFPLLDAEGVHVLESGQPVSTMTTCGACHDTEFIASHSFHVSAGLESFTEAGARTDGFPWEMSNGLFGGWDPLTYRYLTPQGDTLLDLGTPDWIKLVGARHVGGGPAQFSREGTPLTDLTVDASNPETHSYAPGSDQVTPWDWNTSGVVEPNCFLCHLAQPNHVARQAEMASGNFGWANTATLLGSGIVTQTADGWQWQPDAFQTTGELVPEYVTLQDPTPEHCGACHGTVHTDDAPLVPAELIEGAEQALLTGQIFSGQRLRETGLNLAGKAELAQPWDVHAERNLQCSNCHFSLNNPIYYEEPAAVAPGALGL